MRLALFDLDNTLLAGDSDHSWGEWLCQRGLVDAAEYQARNDAFYADYVAGKLDVLAYQAFTQAILGRTEMAQLETWHRQFMQEVIEPIVLAYAQQGNSGHIVQVCDPAEETLPFIGRKRFEGLEGESCPAGEPAVTEKRNRMVPQDLKDRENLIPHTEKTP